MPPPKTVAILFAPHTQQLTILDITHMSYAPLMTFPRMPTVHPGICHCCNPAGRATQLGHTIKTIHGRAAAFVNCGILCGDVIESVFFPRHCSHAVRADAAVRPAVCRLDQGAAGSKDPDWPENKLKRPANGLAPHGPGLGSGRLMPKAWPPPPRWVTTNFTRTTRHTISGSQFGTMQTPLAEF
jgi:hypothetical protein